MKIAPLPSEYAPYHQTYIDLVKTTDILKTLKDQVLDMQSLIADISEDQENFSYAPGKWTTKEVIGHIIDTERIIAYRALTFARNDQTNLPGFEENDYVKNSNFAQRSLYDMAIEFSLMRESNVALFKSFDTVMLSRTGTANNKKVSVRALLYIIAGHQIHHANVIKARYLL